MSVSMYYDANENYHLFNETAPQGRECIKRQMIVPIEEMLSRIDPALIKDWISVGTPQKQRLTLMMNHVLHLWSKSGWKILLNYEGFLRSELTKPLEALWAEEFPYNKDPVGVKVFVGLYPYIRAMYDTERYFVDQIKHIGNIADDYLLEISFIKVY